MIWGVADVIMIEIKCTINVKHLNHPQIISYPPVCGKVVFHKTGLWYQKGWGLMVRYNPKHQFRESQILWVKFHIVLFPRVVALFKKKKKPHMLFETKLKVRSLLTLGITLLCVILYKAIGARTLLIKYCKPSPLIFSLWWGTGRTKRKKQFSSWLKDCTGVITALFSL